MVIWKEPIINRSQSDVDSLKLLAKKISSIGWDNISQGDKIKWMLGNPVRLVSSDSVLKTSDGLYIIVGDGKILGALNVTDLNRIQNNILYIKEFLETLNITVNLDESNPIWKTGDYITLQQFNVIRDNVILLADAWYKYSSTPVIEYSNPVNFQDINDIEKNLYDMYNLIDVYFQQIKPYCGKSICGNQTNL